GLLALGNQKIIISRPERYKAVLRDRCIMVSPAERQAKIERELESLAKKMKGRVILPPDLLAEVVNMTAYPVALLGQFDASYLSLPPEVLIVVLKKHQKFFPLESSRGQLLNHFIGVRNGPSEYQDDVRQGYERVVHARFADAGFFFEQDKKIPLESLASRLSEVGFHEKLGSLWDKTVRVRGL